MKKYKIKANVTMITKGVAASYHEIDLDSFDRSAFDAIPPEFPESSNSTRLQDVTDSIEERLKKLTEDVV